MVADRRGAGHKRDDNLAATAAAAAAAAPRAAAERPRHELQGLGCCCCSSSAGRCVARLGGFAARGAPWGECRRRVLREEAPRGSPARRAGRRGWRCAGARTTKTMAITGTARVGEGGRSCETDPALAPQASVRWTMSGGRDRLGEPHPGDPCAGMWRLASARALPFISR